MLLGVRIGVDDGRARLILLIAHELLQLFARLLADLALLLVQPFLNLDLGGDGILRKCHVVVFRILLHWR